MLGDPGHRSISLHNSNNKIKKLFFLQPEHKNSLFDLNIKNEFEVYLSATASKEPFMLNVILIPSDVKYLALLTLIHHIKTTTNRTL